jgi:hypothetical protein
LEKAKKLREILVALGECAIEFSSEINLLSTKKSRKDRASVLTAFDERLSSKLLEELNNIFKISEECLFSAFSSQFPKFSTDISIFSRKIDSFMVEPFQTLADMKEKFYDIKSKLSQFGEEFEKTCKFQYKDSLFLENAQNKKTVDNFKGISATWMAYLTETYFLQKYTIVENTLNLYGETWKNLSCKHVFTLFVYIFIYYIF